MRLFAQSPSKPVLDQRRFGGRTGLSSVALVLGGLIALAVIGGLVYMKTYNGLVTRQEAVTASMTEIKNQYKRRYDLIPQLVETVKGAADFEQETITAVTAARARVGQMQLPEDLASDPAALQKFMDAQAELGGALSRLLVVAENYPQLTATAGFRDLQSQLEGTENRIAVARRDAIDALKDFNASVKRFPGSLVAGRHGIETLPQLEFAEDTADLETAPTIDFSGE